MTHSSNAAMAARSPLRSIRDFCLECQGGSFTEVHACTDRACPLYAYRHGKALAKGKHQPTRVMKRYCLEYCQAGAGNEKVKNCQGDKAATGPCPIFPFRLGKNPNISEMTREKRRRAACRQTAKGVSGFSKIAHHGPNAPPKINGNCPSRLMPVMWGNGFEKSSIGPWTAKMAGSIATVQGSRVYSGHRQKPIRDGRSSNWPSGHMGAI